MIQNDHSLMSLFMSLDCALQELQRLRDSALRAGVYAALESNCDDLGESILTAQEEAKKLMPAEATT